MTVIPSCSRKFTGYWYPDLSFELKRFFGFLSSVPLEIDSYPLQLRGHKLDHHDFLHYEVSLLEPIQIGADQVTGIHGLCLWFLVDADLKPAYDGLLDEARVGIHEWVTRPTIYNTFKLMNWIVWFLRQGINPFAVIMRHLRTLRTFKKTDAYVSEMVQLEFTNGVFVIHHPQVVC
jgi:hypothetical protein